MLRLRRLTVLLMWSVGGLTLAQDAGTATATPKPTAVTESIDDQARFLAGLPVDESSPLAALQKSAWWKAYAKSLDTDWVKLKEQRLDAMIAWRSSALAPKIDLKNHVYYLFSGPDFLSVDALYPDAPTYILCGLEPLGRVPKLTALGAGPLSEAMANLRKSLNSIVRLSFFKTIDMAGDFDRTELRGVLPLLYFFIARADAKILSMEYIEIAESGELISLGDKEGKKGVPGVHLRFQHHGKDAVQDLYYLRHDVENAVIKTGPGFFTFFKKFQPANSFLKAASFLLHKPERYGLTREFILNNSASILQDDSGVPYTAFQPASWKLTFYGKYLRPNPPFTNRMQDDLAEAFKTGPVEPLPFVTGYRHVGESNLVLALPTGVKPEPTDPTKPDPKPEVKKDAKKADAGDAKPKDVKPEPAKPKDVKSEPTGDAKPKDAKVPEPKKEPAPAAKDAGAK